MNKFITLTNHSFKQEIMEDIFQFIIFAVFALVGIVQAVSKKKTQSDFEEPEDDETLEDILPEVSPEEHRIPKRRSKGHQMEAYAPPFQSESVIPTTRPIRPTRKPVSSQAPPPQKKIKLSNREEARRAFIYSEIFRRKY